MADFSSVGGRILRMNSAHDVLRMLRDLYRHAKSVADLIDKYQTDADFKLMVDQLYTTDQLDELKNMVQDARTLKTHYETDHQSVIEGPGDTVFIL